MTNGTAQNGSLYVAHEKVYPREIKGTFQSLRNASVFILLGIYYLLPWVNWDGRQAVLFDLPARKFYIFELIFWPQDFYFLTWLLVIAALTLFLTTAVAGRVWCGYACPQTVWTEVFIWMERWTEGDRNRQIKLDKAPWTLNKIGRKSLKYLLWIVFSLWTGFTFVGYFTPITELGTSLLHLGLGPWEWFWGLFYSFATFGNAGFMREQVCKYMCPYARFQSAMFDDDTLIIGYDARRGEPRGRRKKGVDPRSRGLGDCIDCIQCVQVCPTGIDIREGLQYDCIACGACIDACDQVMDKMGYPRRLIRYTTQNADDRRKRRLLRPRTVVYSLLWVLLVTGFVTAVAHRTPLALDVIRDRNALYRQLSDERIENVYTLKLMNKDDRPHRYRIAVSGLEGAALVGDAVVEVAAGEVRNVPARVRAPLRPVKRVSHSIRFHAVSLDDAALRISEPSRFLKPAPSR